MSDALYNIIETIDWMRVITVLWTAVLLPLITYMGNEIRKWAKSKRIDKYADILERNIVNAVKDVYETVVKDIKGTEDWTVEKQNEIKDLAKKKAVQALSNSAYECLKAVNEDFEEYIDSLIGTALFDVKNNIK